VEVMAELTKDEKSLLLLLEACAVDNSGRIDLRRINSDDIAIGKRWNESGFVKFGRIRAADIFRKETRWCHLSPEALKLAHEERTLRAERGWSRREYLTTEEEGGK
jgi:hypothetical protein